ncbi:MAG: efflux RND transporter periplasmic adaptor subunit [Candidatus Aminicenantes bacterium]|nr:efflux RND transporter periplasmic adaptor subunit [Candidatus Aminicenantes bacterium]
MNKRKFFIAIGVVIIAGVLIWRVLKTNEAEEENIIPEVAVHVGTINKATLRRAVIAYGLVEPQPAGVKSAPGAAHIASPFAGVLAQVNCHEGQKVKQGSLLFSLDSRLADLQVEKAKQALSFAKFTYERQKNLLAAEGTSQKNFEEARQLYESAMNELANAQTQAKLLQIAAPIDGVITRMNVRPGEAVETTTVLADIANLEKLVVTAAVPSREALQLQVGQTVEIDGGGARETGKLIFVGSDVDPRSDTVVVRASLPADAAQKLGQFLALRIICEEHKDCLAIAETGLVRDEEGKPAIMMVEGEIAVRENVKVGIKDAGLVEIAAEGLKEGLPVVTEGAYGLPDRTKIIIIEEKKEAPETTKKD